MGATGWVLFATSSVACLAIALWMYQRLETPGRGRTVLAMLRWAALTVAILLLFDPVVPASGMPGPGRTQIVLDGSLSMRGPGVEGGTAWAYAVAEAERRMADGAVLVFGATTRAVPVDSLADLAPTSPSSRLLPALQAAAESGVGGVTVLTDGRIEDAAEVRRWLPSLGIDVDFVIVSDTAAANRSLVELDAPRWAQAGEPATIEFGVVATGPAQDSVRVALLQDGEPLAEAAAAWPQPGRVATGTLRFVPAGGADPTVRYEVRVMGTDALPEDDARAVHIRVGERPAGVVLIGLQPDWELRFLQPVLERALGLPVQGYLRTRDRGFVRSAAGLGTAEAVAEETVREAAAGADLLVLQGLGPASPEWAFEAGRTARRLLVLPAGEIDGLGVPVETGRPSPGEWYPSDDVPASPVAGLLAGIDATDAPPLTALTRPDLLASAWSPLLATRGRRGQPAPVLVAGETDGRRWAVATAEGYWRWAFRGGAPGELYARLWSSVAGWLVREQSAIAASAVWPATAVVGAGRSPRWISTGLGADSLRLTLLDGAGVAVTDTVVPVRGDTATTPAPATGEYGWRATAFRADSTVAEATGRLTAETFSEDYSRPRVRLADLEAEGVALAGGRAGGRPLHALPWAYLLLVGLIGAEWILRRRWGLR